MPSPQPGLFEESSNNFYYLEYRLNFSAPVEKIRDAIEHSIEKVFEDVSVVVAFGKKAWNTLQPDWKPKDLTNFETIEGVNHHRAPSTQRDVLFWVHGLNHDHNFDQVLKVQSVMHHVADVILDLFGFTYKDSRDLIGFVDGSANPQGEDRFEAALIPEGEPGAGGSYVLSQKWVHDLDAFQELSVGEQEKIVGRTKPDSIELEGKEMPADSHVSRTDVKVNGKAMKIYRRSAPYGSAGEHGLYFLAFACEIQRFSIQLDRMFGLTEDGLHDKIIEYSRAMSSSYWFAPSQEDLKSIL